MASGISPEMDFLMVAFAKSQEAIDGKGHAESLQG
jgi:hypothetical protein